MTDTPKEILRRLFTDHAVYTKFFIESSLEESPDVKAVTARLLANQDDIGEYVGRVIGKTKGARLTKLLKEHILRAADCVSELKEGEDLKDAIAALMENAEDVGQFLHALNPEKLPLRKVTDEFKRHNKYVLDIAVAHHSRKYATEIRQYDAYYNHMLMFSDMLHAAL